MFLDSEIKELERMRAEYLLKHGKLPTNSQLMQVAFLEFNLRKTNEVKKVEENSKLTNIILEDESVYTLSDKG